MQNIPHIQYLENNIGFPFLLINTKPTEQNIQTKCLLYIYSTVGIPMTYIIYLHYYHLSMYVYLVYYYLFFFFFLTEFIL